MAARAPSIAVIGAGIGGLTAAACLRRAGIDVRIYEQARGFTRLGAGIQQAPNAIRVLYALGLKDALLAQAFRDLGQTSKTISVYKELAHLYAEQGRVEEGRATWRRVLELVNEVRARGASCGRVAYKPAMPLRPAPSLDRAAELHAQDMAEHAYFEHEDRTGQGPADRVRAGECAFPRRDRHQCRGRRSRRTGRRHEHG